MRVRYSINAAISSTSSEERDLGNKKYEVVCDTLNEGGTWKTRLAAGATDVNVSLRDVAVAKLLVVSTSAADPNEAPGVVSLKRNNIGAEAIEIVPLPTTKQGHFLVSTQGLTAVFLSNPGTVAMDVVLTVAGD